MSESEPTPPVTAPLTDHEIAGLTVFQTVIASLAESAGPELAEIILEVGLLGNKFMASLFASGKVASEKGRANCEYAVRINLTNREEIHNKMRLQYQADEAMGVHISLTGNSRKCVP